MSLGIIIVPKVCRYMSFSVRQSKYVEPITIVGCGISPVFQFFYLAGLSILYYDYVLTFNDEVRVNNLADNLL